MSDRKARAPSRTAFGCDEPSHGHGRPAARPSAAMSHRTGTGAQPHAGQELGSSGAFTATRSAEEVWRNWFLRAYR
jgi:hypothetical protein